MRPDGTIVRRYEINLSDCQLLVREAIRPGGEHVCLVRTVINSRTHVVTRLVVGADGSMLLAPQEMYREPGFDAAWLPWDFTLEDFLDLIRFRG